MDRVDEVERRLGEVPAADGSGEAAQEDADQVERERELAVHHRPFSAMFCSSAVLDPTVGHTMDVLSPLISLFCHSGGLFHGESCPRLHVVHPVVFLACVHLA